MSEKIIIFTVENIKDGFLAQLVNEEEEIYQLVTSTGEIWEHTLSIDTQTPIAWSEFKIEDQMMVTYVEVLESIQRYVIGKIKETGSFNSNQS
ncbi:hypothetical protein [Acinetobacter bereziniae]|uniref:hypothetical protein n=1 Tax=Acinetobacter bereziniae TaxID=106648 RepID=UPI003570A609